MSREGGFLSNRAEDQGLGATPGGPLPSVLLVMIKTAMGKQLEKYQKGNRAANLLVEN